MKSNIARFTFLLGIVPVAAGAADTFSQQVIEKTVDAAVVPSHEGQVVGSASFYRFARHNPIWIVLAEPPMEVLMPAEEEARAAATAAAAAASESVIVQTNGTAQFGFGRSKPSDTSVLVPVLADARDASATVSITGYTDGIGSDAYNGKLSVKRASAVAGWLVKQGVEQSKLTVAGKGKNDPVADNGTKIGRAANRRVEVNVKREAPGEGS